MKRIVCLLLVLIVCAYSLTSCGEREYTEDTFFGMDTFVTLKVDRKDGDAEKIFASCKEVLEALDGEFSRHDDGSTAYKYNNGSEKMSVSGDFKELVTVAEEIRLDTDGAFTVTAGALTELWEACELRGRAAEGAEFC